VNMRTMARVLLSAVALNVASFATAGAQTNYYGESLDTVVTLDRSATIDLSLLSGRVTVTGSGVRSVPVRSYGPHDGEQLFHLDATTVERFAQEAGRVDTR